MRAGRAGGLPRGAQAVAPWAGRVRPESVSVSCCVCVSVAPGHSATWAVPPWLQCGILTSPALPLHSLVGDGPL